MGPIEKSTTSANEREFVISQLSKIDGIARKTAETMYAIGIHTYADLAQYLRVHTVEEVSGTLKEHGINRPPGLINKQAWIQQAEIFGHSENSMPTSPAEETKPNRNPEETPPHRESRDHDAVFTVSFDLVRDDGGKPVLSTTVYDEKNAGEEMVFQGNDTSQWVNWMLERANLPFGIERPEAEIEVAKALPEAKAKAAVLGTPTEPYNAQITINNVLLTSIEPSPEAPEKKLRAEIKYHLSGAGAEELTLQGFLYRIEISTADFGTGISELVASKDGRLEPHTFEYTHQLEFAMPAVGRYELHSVVRLPPSGNLIGSHRGPTFGVTP